MATTPPSSDPQVPQTDTVIVGSVNQAVLQQANPTVASAYTADFVAEKNEIIATQVKQLEATQGFPVTDSQLAGITAFADAPARFIVNTKYQDEIEAANAAQSVPAGTPPPTIAPADIDAPLPTISQTDPNFISNPNPVDNTIDPETPQPVAEFGGGKRFEPEPIDEFDALPDDVDFNYIPNPTPVAPSVNPVVPQPTFEQNFFVDAPATVSPAANPEVPQPQPVQNFFTDAEPEPVENYFTDATPTPIVQNYFTDATPVSPTANPQVSETPIIQNYFVDDVTPVSPTADPQVPETPIIQNYFIDDVTPVSPTANPQVPNIFSSIATFFSNLFGITPVPVTPAANPQVAQAFPVPTPTVLTPTPIPPAENPQVPPTPIVQNYFTDATPAPVAPAANPQVPETPIVQNYFVDEPTPVVQNYFTDAAPAPIVQNYFTDATPVSPANNPEVPQPPDNTALLAKLSKVLESPAGSNTTVSPTTDPQVPTDNVKIDGPVSITTLYARDPITARDYTVFKNETAQQLTEERLAEARDANGGEISVSEQVQIAARAEADATAAANSRYQVEIVRERAAAFVPADTPPPTTSAGAVSNDPQVVVPPTRVVDVSTETLLQNDPETARQYTAFKTETTQQLTEQRLAEARDANGGEISVSEQVMIAKRAEIDATFEANNQYQDQIEAARAGTVVPADTPPPTVAAPAVSPDDDSQVPAQEIEVNVGGKRADPDIVDDPQSPLPNDVDPNFISNPGPVNSTIDPEVPSSANTRVENVNQSQLAATNPELYQQWQTTFIERASRDAANEIKIVEAELGRSITAEERATIESVAAFRARSDTNAIYKDELQAANVATTVPADTPPPTTAAPAVDPESDAQVPADTGKITDFSYSELTLKDPDTATALITDQRQIQQNLVDQQVAEYRATTGLPAGEPLPPDVAARIQAETFEQAKTEVQIKYQDEIVAAGAGTLVPEDTPPPTVAAPTVDSATNQQVPPAATGEPLIDPDTGEVLGYVDTATGDITDTPTAVGTADPQVPSSANSQIVSVDQSRLSQFDSAFFNDYNSAVVNNTDTAEAQLTKQALDTYGVSNVSDLPLDVQLDIREQALTTGVTEANAEFKDQLEASGAATSEPVGTPPPTPAPAPPSPSPYEIFIAQEAAATDAAQAEATARFNSQFDVVTEDPQVFPVTDPGDGIQVTEIETVGDEFSGYEDFYGTEQFNNVGEFQAELVPNEFSGYDEFYGDDTGEFQDLSLEPAVGDGESAGYDEFYGDDTGEFQDLSLEPAVGDGESAGYDEFYGDDTGEFQDLSLEPAAGDGESAGFGNFFGDVAAGASGLVKSFAGAVSSAVDPQANSAQQFALDSISGLIKSAIKTPNQLAAERQAAAKAQAQAQQQVNAQRKQANEGDWRVRLRLAGGADYLYKAKGANGKSAAGILEPLAVTDGVIFPYTPQITTQYQAKYNPYDLTHSNYRGYFYQGSNVGEINITAQFTAQDTSEANYLLAVIHFFRSVTKMFYGQDDASKRGAPPPLVFLQGLGEYQFNLHPCVIANFNYTLPADVDYIRANSTNFDGTNLLQRRDRQNLPIDYVNTVSSRLSNAGLTKGGLNTPPPPPTLGTKSPTYVPTKMEIQLVLLPMQTRNQVSQQFSLKQFANGDLIRGGFW